jgi:hypothetical protein
MDLWGTDGGPGPANTTPPAPANYQQSSTIGVTHGSSSLQFSIPQGQFWGPSTQNMITVNRNDLMQATTLSFDETMLSTELNGNPAGDTTDHFSGFAQSNELAVTLFSPSTGSNLNLFIQHAAFGALTDSLGQGGGWNGVDGTRTLTWDLSKFTITDPHDSQTKTVAQFLTQYPDIVDSKIAITAQTGGGSPLGAARFYFDNVQLNGIPDVPEPLSLGMLLTGLPVLALRRRRAC